MKIEDLKINCQYNISYMDWKGKAIYLGLANEGYDYSPGTLLFKCEDGVDGFFRIEHVVSEVLEYLIWSIEHSGYWKYNNFGYTKYRSEAKRYSFEEALETVKNGNRFSKDSETPNEAIVPDKN
jgi:hypothetical protein